METRPLIFDCDPGQDDAISLVLALSPKSHLNILAITTVAGNTTVEKCQRNARMMAQICGRTDIPIYAGSDRPLHYPLATAEEVHGAEGLSGIEIFEPNIPLRSEHGVDAIIRLCRAHKNVVLVPTGPLTNIATALTRAPDIAANIDEIVLMGGAGSEGGNITPTAEFNIYVDPHAAKIVFDSSIKKTVFSLDVTHKALIRDAHVDAIQAIGTKFSAIMTHMLRSDYADYDRAKFGTLGTPIHDACTAVYLQRPEIFTFKPAAVHVVTDCALARGQTQIDYGKQSDSTTGINWAVDVDTRAFFTTMVDYISAYKT